MTFINRHDMEELVLSTTLRAEVTGVIREVAEDGEDIRRSARHHQQLRVITMIMKMTKRNRDSQIIGTLVADSHILEEVDFGVVAATG